MMTDLVRNKGEHLRSYEIAQCKTRGEFDIYNNISDHAMLIKLIDTSSSFNHSVSITRFWIYDSNYKRELPLMK